MIYMLGYKARSGKDALAQMMVERDGYVRLAFADFLKDICQQLFFLSYEQLHGNLKEVLDPRYDLSPRQILQQVGTKMREVYSDVWVNYVIQKIKADPNKNYVITDFRFPNEGFKVLDAFPDLRVILTNVVRPNRTEVTNHVSETSLDHFIFDLTLANDGTIEDLYRKWSSYNQMLSV